VRIGSIGDSLKGGESLRQSCASDAARDVGGIRRALGTGVLDVSGGHGVGL
jgi:hypothetical protein